MKISTVFLGLAIFLLGTAGGCRIAAEEPLKPPPVPIQVSSAVIEAQLMPRSFPLTGSLVANQQADVADLVKAVLKGIILAVVCKANPVQQVRHGQEQSGHAQGHVVIGDGCRQVGFAAAVAAGKHDPGPSWV